MLIYNSMTVGSLIRRLQNLPESLPVVLDGGKVDYLPLEEADREVVVSQEHRVLWDDDDFHHEGERIEALVLR